MAKKSSENLTISKTNFILIVAAFVLVIGILVGYFIAKQGFGQVTLTREELYPKYAGDIKIVKSDFKDCLASGKYTDEVLADYDLGTNIGVRGTPTFVINGQLVPIGAAPYSQFKQILDKELVNSSNRSLALSLMDENDPTKGDKNAPIVMLEFSDFQCPFCAKFWAETLPQIEKNYVDTGKVYFVYKDFPLSEIHPFAQQAAEAALCAGEQGKFWEYHDKLFENQVQWAK